MSKKKKKNDNLSPRDKNSRMDYDEILNDGWADDVRVEQTLEFLPIDDDMIRHYNHSSGNASPDRNISDEGDDPYYSEEYEGEYDEDDIGNDEEIDDPYYDEEDWEEDADESTSRSTFRSWIRKKFREFRTKKVSGFRIFLLVYIGAAIILMSFGLIYFYDFLEDYEATYQASLPYHKADELISILKQTDAETLGSMVTDIPVISQYEELSVYQEKVHERIAGKELRYVPSKSYTDDAPSYTILADGVPVGQADFSRSPDELPYHFPIWHMSSLSLPVTAQISARISAPANSAVMINGLSVAETDCVERGIANEKNEYVEPYTTLPSISVYEVSGLYEEPVVTAIDMNGAELPVHYDETTKTYKADFPHTAPDQEELEAYAIEVVSNYALYISKDLPDGALDKYFTPNNKYLYYIDHNSSRQFFTKHSNPTIQNEEVREFIYYNDDAYYCEVYLEEAIKMAWGSSEPEILPTDGKFYFVKIDGEWKASGIEY